MHSVRVTAFFLDHYEVTNQEFAAALNWALAQGGLITVTNAWSIIRQRHQLSILRYHRQQCL
jgi:formylglycine-generating enzyme required for sulfatase activity